MTVAPLTVAEAQAALDAAKAAVADMEHSLCEAKTELELAQDALRDAKVNADAGLPRGRMFISYWCKQAPYVREVVVVKRTAQRVTVRQPGQDAHHTFRLDEGRWYEYPKPKGSNTSRRLELDE